MAKQFREVDPESLNENSFRLIGTEWMLITPGTPESFNTMTASWGSLGILWNKKVATCVIRPVRHTFGFMERSPVFTLSFFDREYRDALNLCGSKSGRDTDKVKATGLVPVASPSGGVYFEQARLVLECRKLYWHDLDPGHFLDPKIDGNYPKKDYHRMYVGEITACLAG
jgi:flavin reductase (DIM6/NTAB) family NADH-FMN oxidoreductase RutF